jgi:hypothetical protein
VALLPRHPRLADVAVVNEVEIRHAGGEDGWFWIAKDPVMGDSLSAETNTRSHIIEDARTRWPDAHMVIFDQGGMDDDDE